MKKQGRFARLLDGVRSMIPTRQEEPGSYEEEYPPEDYGNGYPPEDYGGEYPDEGFEEYPPYMTYDEAPDGWDEPQEEHPSYGPEELLPEEEIPSMDEPEDGPIIPMEDIPIEEFTMDEMAEEAPPEDWSAAPAADAQPAPETPSAPATSWEMPEPEEPVSDDPRRRPRLLSKKGRLRHPGWAETDLYEYNKERIRHPFRRKEWELYQLHTDRFAFTVCYGHAAYMSLLEVTLTDFATGEKFTSGKRQFFPGDSLDLDFSGGQPHSLKYEDEELFLSISFDGETRRILARSGELEAELSCHETGDAIVTAVPFDAAGQFAYNYKKIFLDLSGHLNLHNVEQPLDADTFLTLWSGRGVWPYSYSTLWAAGAQETEEGILALNLGGGYGREGAPTENAVFVDGSLVKLEQVYFRFSTENLMKPWRIVDRERRLKLSFRPIYDDYTARRWGVVDTRSHQLFGRLSGHIELPDGTKREIRDMSFFCQHGEYRW